MTKVFELFGLEQSKLNEEAIPMFAGIECEIESVAKRPKSPYFNAIEDGSLRNDGCEFVSVPMQVPHLLDQFKDLQASIVFHNREDAFSSRTSTHVHVNCRSFNEQQVKNMLYLYAIFEEVFFSMVNKDRRNNIHCVPLSETFLPMIYRFQLPSLIPRWHKYTALNMLPLAKYGTMEFRHLQGTDDASLLQEWLTALESLWQLSKDSVITPVEIADTNSHKRWFHKVFGHSARCRALEPALPQIIQNGLLDVKLSLI